MTDEREQKAYEQKMRAAERAHDGNTEFFHKVNEATITTGNLAIRNVMRQYRRLISVLNAVGVAAVVLNTNSFSADYASANLVMPGCRNFTAETTFRNLADAFLQGNCAGIVDGLYYTQADQKCGVKGVTVDQVVRVVVQYIDSQPAHSTNNLEN